MPSSEENSHRLLQCYHRQNRDRRRCSYRGIPSQSPATSVISQWEPSLEWRHAVTLHILVGKICISFFLFYCEGMLSLVVLWLCGGQIVLNIYEIRVPWIVSFAIPFVDLFFPLTLLKNWRNFWFRYSFIRKNYNYFVSNMVN